MSVESDDEPRVAAPMPDFTIEGDFEMGTAGIDISDDDDDVIVPRKTPRNTATGAPRRMTTEGRMRPITMEMITRRCLDPSTVDLNDHTAVSRKMLELTKLTLDGEQITHIDNVEALGSVTHVYLQNNRVCSLENINFFFELRFLALQNNDIEEVTGLSSLDHLTVVDLSNNRIARVRPDDFPPSLVYLNLRGNDCTMARGYREAMIDALPRLTELDEVAVEEDEELNTSQTSMDSDERAAMSSANKAPALPPVRTIAERGDPTHTAAINVALRASDAALRRAVTAGHRETVAVTHQSQSRQRKLAP